MAMSAAAPESDWDADVDLPLSEVARVMGCSEGTVKSTLHDARERLRSLLEVTE